MSEVTSDIELQLLTQAIYLKYSYDFRDYAWASLKRRVNYALEQMECASISELQARVLHDAGAFQRLLQYFTIPTTEMFRDPAFFLAIREQVVPVLCTYPSINVWIAGCSTGEELYSMAILLREEGLLARSTIYATDINPTSLAAARKGVFSLDLMQNYTLNYQRSGGRRSFADYYTAAYGGALFDRTLCDTVSFADHSLATDEVFAEMHLICCRNVLIYFNADLQERALGLFHESLCRRGFLGLGSKESIDFSRYAKSFEPLVKTQRIYRRR